ncbi:uncharacterized protein LOC111101462 isoform X3 [Crassostrea virginica]
MACQELPGFYGSFCNITCPSGSYGVDCAGDCTPTCLYYQCHHVYGCMKNITDQITTISSAITTDESASFTLGKTFSRNEDISEPWINILSCSMHQDAIF